MEEVKIEEIKEAWEKETDKWLFDTVTKNLNDYTPEVCAIICEEAQQRNLITYEINEEDSEHPEFAITVVENGQDILDDLEETSPKNTAIKLLKTIVVFFFAVMTFGMLMSVCGTRVGNILMRVIGWILYIPIEIIWPNEEERWERREEQREQSMLDA